MFKILSRIGKISLQESKGLIYTFEGKNKRKTFILDRDVLYL